MTAYAVFFYNFQNRVSNQKYSLEIVPGANYTIELISPGEEQLAQNQGKIQAGIRVVLSCDIWNNGILECCGL